MRLQDFHVELADWFNDDQRTALLDLREEVFIREQGVSEQRERDGLDGDCRHVLARDEAGQPIGCGRLTPQHKIGRMAVLPSWRGRGVGAAMLRELVACARSLGWPEVALDAQVTALGFYERAGFTAYGEEFIDADMAHVGMKLVFPPVPDATPAAARDTGRLPTGSREEIAAARLQLLADAQHQVSIRLPLLDPGSYADAAELAELRRLATSGRRARVRILLHDPEAALRQDHRLIALVQRLTSAIEVRMPVEESDLSETSACLLNDTGGYLFLPEADRVRGRAARHDRPAAAPLQQHFDEVWERSVPAGMLHALHL